MTATMCIAKKPGLRGYKTERCRCRNCTDASNAYDNKRRRRLGYGTWQPLVDAKPVERHIAALNAIGLGDDRIGELAGLHHKTVAAIMRPVSGRTKAARVRPATAQAILNIPVDPHLAADGAHIDASPTRRHIHAMRAAGWTAEALGGRLGCSGTNIAAITKQQYVQADTARKVAALYAEIAHQRPEGWAADRARRQAAAKGWVAAPAYKPACNPGGGTGWELRIAWPINDPAMYDNEAIAAAWIQVPQFAEAQQATIAGPPRMRVQDATPQQYRDLGATRVVVCVVPAIRRIPKELSPAAARGNQPERNAT